MFCTPKLDDVDKGLGCAFLRWSTTDGEYHGTVAEEKLKNGTALNAGAWFAEESFSAIHAIVHIARGCYGIPSLR